MQFAGSDQLCQLHEREFEDECFHNFEIQMSIDKSQAGRRPWEHSPLAPQFASELNLETQLASQLVLDHAGHEHDEQ